jgi:hypothetical protein
MYDPLPGMLNTMHLGLQFHQFIPHFFFPRVGALIPGSGLLLFLFFATFNEVFFELFLVEASNDILLHLHIGQNQVLSVELVWLDSVLYQIRTNV